MRACPCGGRRVVEDRADRTAVTAAGRVAIRRRSMRCGRCGLAAYPADARVGLEVFLSPGATRLACLAAATWSFDLAAARLEELAGIRIDDETIRRHVHRAAAAAARRRDEAPPRAAFDAAEGQAEFLADGVMAPTRGGWRELKLAIYLKRPAGEPAATCPGQRPASPTPRSPTARRSRRGGARGQRPWASTRPDR